MTSGATKHSRNMIEIDEYLRSKSQGQRIHVTVAQTLDALPNQTMSGVANALRQLSRMVGTGLKRARTSGAYEYVMPPTYPQGLLDLKKALRLESVPASRNTMLTDDVLSWITDHPASIFGIQQVVSDLGQHSNSVATILLRLSKSGVITARPDIKRGMYEAPPTTRANVSIHKETTTELPVQVVVRETRFDGSGSGAAFGTAKSPITIGIEPTSAPLAEVVPITPVQPKPTPTTMAVAVERKAAALIQTNLPTRDKLYEYVGPTKSGGILLRNLETGTHYTAEEL